MAKTKATSPTTIFQRIEHLEAELQRLKIEAYLSLPQESRPIAPYQQEAILKAVENTREELWNARYAKKVAGLP